MRYWKPAKIVVVLQVFTAAPTEYIIDQLPSTAVDMLRFDRAFFCDVQREMENRITTTGWSSRRRLFGCFGLIWTLTAVTSEQIPMRWKTQWRRLVIPRRTQNQMECWWNNVVVATRCSSFHSDVYKQIKLAFDRPRQLSKVVVYNLTSRALPDARSLRAYRDYTSGARFDDRKSVAQKKKAARSKH